MIKTIYLCDRCLEELAKDELIIIVIPYDLSYDKHTDTAKTMNQQHELCRKCAADFLIKINNTMLQFYAKGANDGSKDNNRS